MDVIKEIDLSDSSSKSSDDELEESSADISAQQSSSSYSGVGLMDQLEDSETGSTDLTQKKAKSLLDVLKCPKSFTLVRKRKIAANVPPTGKRRCKSSCKPEKGCHYY